MQEQALVCALDDVDEVIGAGAKVCRRKALGGEGGQPRDQRDHGLPHQLLLGFPEVQHNLHNLAIPRQHKLACNMETLVLTLFLPAFGHPQCPQHIVLTFKRVHRKYE